MGDNVIRFDGATIQNVNIYRNALAGGEKFLEGVNAKLTASQKEALRGICNDHGMDMSAFARDAITFYLDLFPYKDKIEKHKRLLRQIVGELS